MVGLICDTQTHKNTAQTSTVITNKGRERERERTTVHLCVCFSSYFVCCFAYLFYNTAMLLCFSIVVLFTVFFIPVLRYCDVLSM